MADLRVLHVNDQAGWGGGELQTFLLIQQLEAMGVENHALVRRGGMLDLRLGDLLPAPRRHSIPGALWTLAPLVLRGLRSRVDVVHAHTGRATQCLAWAGDRPTVAHRRIPDRPGPRGLRRLSGVELVLCVSREILRRLEALPWPNGRKPRLACVHSAAHLPETATSLLPLEGAPVLGFMGHFRHHKGLDLLLEALPTVLKAYPGLVLHLAGEGPEEARLKHLAMGLASAVRFHPLPKEPAAFLGALDLFTMPSREEGLGSVALLSQALAVPVLATRAGGIPEGVRHGETGWLVEADNARALAEGLVHALADKERLHAWGAAGPAWIADNFSAASMARGTLRHYRELLDWPCP